jgi:hypothetical protein
VKQWNGNERRKSGFTDRRMPFDCIRFAPPDLGQNCPQQYPHLENQSGSPQSPLGVPLAIREVARLIGCSPWTIRHRYVPVGLPHIRSGPNGKLIFYPNQVIRWLLTQQQKGGIVR